LVLATGGLVLIRHSQNASDTAVAALANTKLGVVDLVGVVSGGLVAGTGMVLTSDGLVLTNNHVVAGVLSLEGQVEGQGPRYTATVIGVDPTVDVALIRLNDASNLHPVPIDTSGTLALGDAVTGLGNALGKNGPPVVATGKVTSLDQSMGVSNEDGTVVETLNGLIAFDAPIQPGDSGGPLVNSAGSVIGMDTAASSAQGSSTFVGNFGAAIPITQALSVVKQIEQKVVSPYIEGPHSGVLGISAVDADNSGGAKIVNVNHNDKAAAAGIVPGDVIISVDDTPVRSLTDLQHVMRGRLPGEQVSVIWIDGNNQQQQAMVTLSQGPPA
jgi:S1-C subfamily serine protease